ncbi:TonB-dependent receptor [Sphingomonas sp. AOB5]|uniref:TonB-dependent receptor domain-containing protein n=1 Tax=Sphingomonas sp. AOB5 TaxID=3034017 RepID=UPI0023F92EF9|nr:TonB-dependent receptor [Sphingomonas sp. AOB5]MDF7777494.1 TonB-dependent receptor [Sphingomonas sp. AOB5]
MTRRQIRFYLTAAALAGLPAAPALAQNAPPASAPQTPPAKQEAGKPGEIVVSGVRAEVSATPDRTSYNITNDLQAQSGTLADALRNVPGVDVDLQGNVSLRGDPGVTILIDGRPAAVMRSEARGDYLLATPAANIERVEVITNPGAAFSPEGSGGVINLVTKQAKKDTRFATLRGTIGNEGRAMAGVSGGLSKIGLNLTGDFNWRRADGDGTLEQTRSRYDSGSGTFLNSRQDSTQEADMVSYTARAGVDYDVNKQNRLSLEGNYRNNAIQARRDDHFTGPGGVGSYDRISDTDGTNKGGGVRASWRRTFSGTGHELAADFTFDTGMQHRILDGVTTPVGAPAIYERIDNQFDRSDYGVKLDYKRPTGEGRSLNLGYQYDLITNNFDFTGVRGSSAGAMLPVASLTNRFDFRQAVHAVYGTWSLDFGKIELQPGLRLEQADLDINQITDGIRVKNGYFRAYPTLHLGYELTAKQKLRASYSRRIQRPGPSDLNPYTLYIDPLNLRRGNPALRPETTDSFELSWQMRSGGSFYSLTGFYRRSRGGVTDVVQDLGTGVFLTTRANLATAERTGVELVANGKFSKTLGYSASGTFLWNRIDPRLGGVSTPRSGTTGTVRANLTWQPTPKDFFQLNGFYSGDQLVAQGYRQSGGILNFGYRRKVNDRFSAVLTAQNLLDSAEQRFVIDTPLIRDRIAQRGMGRVFMLTLTYNLGNQGNRRRPDAGIDFEPAGGGVQ